MSENTETKQAESKEVAVVTLPIAAPDRTDIETKINNLVDQTSRVVIATDGDMEKATDLVKLLKTIKKRAEDKRKELSGPFDKQAKAINKEWNPWITKVDTAAKKVEGLLTVYAREKAAEERRKREEAIAEQERLALEEAERIAENARKQAAEEKAKADLAAKEAEKAGEHKAAQEIRAAAETKAENITAGADEMAAAALDTTTKAVSITKSQGALNTVRGDYGGTGSLRRTLQRELIDITKVPKIFLVVDEKAINQHVKDYRDAATLAADLKGLKGKEKDAYIFERMSKLEIPGFRFYWSEDFTVR